MPKHGLLHDYDLMANREPAAQEHTCVVCGASPMKFQWSDYSGEGMCMQCGCPYQLKWGSDEQRQEGNYPYLNMKDEWVPVVRRYWKETGRWTYLGTGFNCPGLREFEEWVKKNDAEPKAGMEGE